MFTVGDVLAGTGGRLAAGSRDGTFRSISVDSRAVSPGDLFVALRGQNHDGHDFVGDAFTRGASGALVEALPEGHPWASPDWNGPPVVLTSSSSRALGDLARYWRRKHDIIVVAVTGSVGKTTTKELIASLLAQRFPVLRTPANLNTEIGLPIALAQLQREHLIAVLEMGMYDVGDIRHLARIAEPNIGVVTNVGPSHLERLASMDRVAEAKSELVQELPSSGLAILNADDARVRQMALRTSAPALLYGLGADAALRANDIESHGLRGIEFTVSHGGERLRAKMSTLGAHLVHAALAAVGVGLRLGMSFEEAVGGLRHVEQALRLILVEGIHGSMILDDTYNASPSSMLAALNLLAEMDGRHVAVLGDMLELGAFELEGHRLVGRRAASVVDWLLTVGPRARTVAAEARIMGMSPDRVESCDTTEQVADRLRSGLGTGDFVLVKGSRGMSLDEVVGAIRRGED